MILKPSPDGSREQEERGERVASLQEWMGKVVDEISSFCAIGEEDSVTEAQTPGGVVEADRTWLAKIAMAAALEAFQAELWPQCYGASICCLHLINKLSHCPSSNLGVSSLDGLSAPSACTAAHALLSMFRRRIAIGRRADGATMMSSGLVLRDPITWRPVGPTGGAAAPPMALVGAAQELLGVCRKKALRRRHQRPQPPPVDGRQQQHQSRPEEPSHGGSTENDLGLVLHMLEFRASTYAVSESGQKQALQALMELSKAGGVTVRGADLKQLASLCLEDGQPWRDVPMACVLLGLAIKAEHGLPSPDFPVIAQVRA